MTPPAFENPFRPGAGHRPPYLAGRADETDAFLKLLDQRTILENMILTGLRGVGKTVLLDTFKPKAIDRGWLWVGTDLSESASISEASLGVRLLSDLAVVTSGIVIDTKTVQSLGFLAESETRETTLSYYFLTVLHDATPGLASDKLKAVLEFVWPYLAALGRRGLIFAYDEAQNLADHAERNEYPLSLLLDVFQSIQKKGLPLMLALTGLPTLFPKLVEARTFSERMFRVIALDRLTREASREAILKPIEDAGCPIRLESHSVDRIIDMSGGYPYFIQFICREVFDAFLVTAKEGETPTIPADEIIQKLDTDFFAGRWARATDRQRELLALIAQLPHCEDEFTVQEIVELSKRQLTKPFSGSHVNQMLASLAGAGLIYKNRHGKYAFAVPLLGQFILRQFQTQAAGHFEYSSCFISYSAKDEAFVKRLHADLQQAGVRCWFAPEDLRIGEKTWDAIDRAVRQYNKLLLVLSRNSLSSDWVADEVTKAYAEERRRKEPVLFPIRLDDAVMQTGEPWAVKLRDGRNIGDFNRWKDHDSYQRAFQRVLRDLKATPEEPESDPT